MKKSTIITPQLQCDDEYAIVATFSDKSLDHITSVQQKLESLLGKAIWLTPRKALHSTLMEIICDTEYADLSRKQHFDSWFIAYNQLVAAIISEVSSFELTFNQIEVSQRAIILKSSDSSPFNAIRAKLLSKIDLPSGTKQPPDITHCTIARFSEALDLEETLEKVNAIHTDFTEYLTDFKLMKDLGPLTFASQVLQTYPFEA